MTLVQRRVLFAFFVALFALSSVVVILYAHGYRYHTAKKRVEKTGELIVETKPKGAELFLNDAPPLKRFFGFEQSGIRTPATVKYLPSGTYRLEVKKDGFFPWKESVMIQSGRATLKEGIVLLPNEQPSTLNMNDTITRMIRLNQDTILFVGQHALFLFYELTQKTSLLVSTAQIEPNSVTVSPRGTKILYRNSGNLFTIDATVNAIPHLIHESRQPFSSILWFTETELLVLLDGTLARVNTKNNLSSPVKLNNVWDMIRDDQAVYVLHGLDPVILSRISLNSEVREIVRLSKAFSSLSFTYDGIVGIRDGVDHDVLVDTYRMQGPLTQIRHGHIVWQSRKRFAVVSDYEVWLYEQDGDSYRQTFLTRQSTPLAEGAFSSHLPYLFLRSEGAIRAFDFVSNELQNRYTIVPRNVRAMLFSENEKQLYYTATVGTQSPQLFILPLVK